ncbi:hypothetical protein SFRURICE_004811, partial [Spodoptera frugiperda]
QGELEFIFFNCTVGAVARKQAAAQHVASSIPAGAILCVTHKLLFRFFMYLPNLRGKLTSFEPCRDSKCGLKLAVSIVALLTTTTPWRSLKPVELPRPTVTPSYHDNDAPQTNGLSSLSGPAADYIDDPPSDGASLKRWAQ